MPYKFNPFTSNFDEVLDGSGFGDVVGPASSTDGDIAIFDGATGQLIADGGVGLPLNDGELIIGDTAGDAQIGTITGGTGVTVTNGAGTITIDADNNGDVVGPASATDNAVARFDGATGKIIQDSNVIISDTDVVSGVTQLFIGDSPPANPYEIAIEDSIDGLIGQSIQNTSTGVSAGSNYQAIVEAGSADAFSYYGVNGVTDFSAGIDNSDSDNYKLTTGNSPSAGTVGFQVTPAGVFTLPAAPLDVPSGGTGLTTITDHGIMLGSGVGDVTPTAAPTDGELLIGSTGADPVLATPASSDSLLTITGGAGTLDITANEAVSSGAVLTDFAVVCGDGGARGVQTIASVGTTGQVLQSNGAGALPTFEDAAGGGVSGPVSSTDNALSRWNGTDGDTLQDSTVIVSDNGEMTNASQPSFLAYNITDNQNVTGNGATVTVEFDTEVFDRGNNFSADTFTAPVTGLYHFDVSVRFEALAADMTRLTLQLTTTNRNYQFEGNPGVSKNSFNVYTANFSVLADMNATDTAFVTAQISNGSGDTAGISGAAALITYFSGHLVC